LNANITATTAGLSAQRISAVRAEHGVMTGRVVKTLAVIIALSFVVPKGDRPRGKGPAAGEPGVGTKRGGSAPARQVRAKPPVSVRQLVCDEARQRE
jgi:hypothetical protein